LNEGGVLTSVHESPASKVSNSTVFAPIHPRVGEMNCIL
jgi:hypothetical protein